MGTYSLHPTNNLLHHLPRLHHKSIPRSKIPSVFQRVDHLLALTTSKIAEHVAAQLRLEVPSRVRQVHFMRLCSCLRIGDLHGRVVLGSRPCCFREAELRDRRIDDEFVRLVHANKNRLVVEVGGCYQLFARDAEPPSDFEGALRRAMLTRTHFDISTD